MWGLFQNHTKGSCHRHRKCFQLHRVKQLKITELTPRIGGSTSKDTSVYRLRICRERLSSRQHELRPLPEVFTSSDTFTPCLEKSILS